MLLELEQDINKNQVIRHAGKELTAGAIIGEILQGNKAGFNSWTRSVACYMIPNLQGEHFPAEVLTKTGGRGDALFEETREYVLTRLN